MHQRSHVFLRSTTCIALLLGLALAHAFSPGHVSAASVLNKPTGTKPFNTPVGNNTTYGTPSIYNFGGTLYVLWTGTDNPNHLYITQSTDGLNFTNQRKINDTTFTGFGPQMTTFKGHLYLAWLSSAGDGHIYLGWYNNSSTLNNHTSVPGSCAYTQPAMQTFNSVLYLAWLDCNGRSIDIASSSDGYNFSINQTSDSTVAAPAMTVLSGKLYITWAGTDSHIYLGTYPGYGTQIGPLHQRLTDTTTQDMAIAPYLGYINLVWRGYNNINLYTGYYTGTSQLSNSHSLNIPSNFGPGMCTSFGHLYTAWANPNNYALDITQLS